MRLTCPVTGLANSMDSSKGSQPSFAFGPYEADLSSGELRKSGTRIKIQDLPLRLLSVLAENPGRVVTREELQKRLWPKDTFVDFEDGLNTGVKKLREALGDDSDNPRYIETIPRRGYRFIAELKQIRCQPRRRQSLARSRPVQGPSPNKGRRFVVCQARRRNGCSGR